MIVVRELIEPVVARVRGNRATQRFCRAWFARFDPHTLQLLAEAPPEVFRVLVMHPVQAIMRIRRRYLLIGNGVALFEAVVTAYNIHIGLNVFSFACLALGWYYVIRGWRRLTPEAFLPAFIVRIDELPVIVRELQQS